MASFEGSKIRGEPRTRECGSRVEFSLSGARKDEEPEGRRVSVGGDKGETAGAVGNVLVRVCPGVKDEKCVKALRDGFEEEDDDDGEETFLNEAERSYRPERGVFERRSKWSLLASEGDDDNDDGDEETVEPEAILALCWLWLRATNSSLSFNTSISFSPWTKTFSKSVR